ncbi:MFS transporter [Nocardioides alkalitolerans]|uniref:MFS transporter n=1 Tax=Nocardioides alkalitolerans TaxID=281714 RepID=UPI000415EA88|nr:MFS transporter [Nocardioides alkalitolerans]
MAEQFRHHPGPGDAPPAAFDEPTRAVRGRWVTVFSLAWLGLWMGQLAPLQLLLPAQVDEQLPTDDWLRTLVYFGVVSGIAGLVAVVVYPVAGALSDRTRSRYGRRRPWVAAGVGLLGVGLVLLGAQSTLLGIVACWTVALSGFCVASAALSAVMSDHVPEGQRGYVSGWISAPNAIGILLGLVLVTAVFTGQLAGYVAIAVLLALLAVPFLATHPEPVLTRAQAAGLPPLTARTVAGSLWIDPRQHPDFGWTLLSRVLINLGNAIGTTMLLYFFTYGLALDDPEGFLVRSSLIYMVMTVLSAVVLGRLSDRVGRRRVFVLLSGAAQALAALLLAGWPSAGMAVVGSVVLGLGQGCFFAVDQALATQVLPAAASRGKDMGIMNVAMALPQAMGPLIGAGLVVLTGGFAGLFVASGVAGLLGSVVIYRVRSVR